MSNMQRCTGKKSKRHNMDYAKGRDHQSLSPSNWVFLDLNPAVIRFAHSKIRPVFSGCGRSLKATLNEIRDGVTDPHNLPMIAVIQGPKIEGEAWYFSLNNRRLWVFKKCLEEGLLGESGLIRVRARGPKEHEIDRYTLERCSNKASIMREKLLCPPSEKQPSTDR